MATKSGIKSKIPVKNPRKELLPEIVGIALRNSNPPKPMEMKENKGKTTMVKKEMDVKNKMPSEVKQSKSGNAEKVTTKEKAALSQKPSKQRSTGQSVVRSTIETVSKEIVNHLKAEKFQDCKSSTELVDNGVNVISKNTNEPSSKRKPGEKMGTSPSQMVQPKMYLPHSGLMLKPPAKKSTVFKPLIFHPNRPKLRRSRSEYDPDFERPLPENIRLQQNNKIIEENYTTHQKTKPAKSSTISKNKDPSAMVENKIRKEISVDVRKPLVPLKMSKNLPVENKSARPLAWKSKPLKRTNTIHVFDSIPILKKSADMLKKEPLNSKRIKERMKSENETPVTPENINLPQEVVEDLENHITPKKEVPHRGIVFKLHATKKVNEKKFNAFPNVD